MRRLIQLEVGGETVYIDPDSGDEPIELINASGGPSVTRTGVHEGIERAYEKAKATILAIAEDFGGDLGNLPPEGRPEQISVEFSLSFSAQANIKSTLY